MKSGKKVPASFKGGWHLFVTAGFLLPLAGTGVLEVLGLGPAGAMENMVRLGYPPYILPFLGGIKILGAIVLLAGRWPRLTEWAYAGYFFLLLGAIYSHLCVGDRLAVLAPLGFLVLVGLSYKSRQRLSPMPNRNSGGPTLA